MAGTRCGRGPGWRRRTRCCWSTCARTGPATGAPFDPKASCRAPASPAASAGSTSSGRTSRRERDPPRRFAPLIRLSSSLLSVSALGVMIELHLLGFRIAFCLGLGCIDREDCYLLCTALNSAAELGLRTWVFPQPKKKNSNA